MKKPPRLGGFFLFLREVQSKTPASGDIPLFKSGSEVPQQFCGLEETTNFYKEVWRNDLSLFSPVKPLRHTNIPDPTQRRYRNHSIT
jgi:hypothetical protein